MFTKLYLLLISDPFYDLGEDIEILKGLYELPTSFRSIPERERRKHPKLRKKLKTKDGNKRV